MGTFAAATTELRRLKTGGPRGVLARRDPKTIGSGAAAGDNLVEVKDVRRANERQAAPTGPDAARDVKGIIRYEVGSAASFANATVTFT
jgi:hypothetical protein